MRYHDRRRESTLQRARLETASSDFFLQERISALLKPSHARRRQRQSNSAAK